MIPERNNRRLTLDVLLDKMIPDLKLVLAGNGYKKVAFALIVHELGGDEQSFTAGNLEVEGMRALLNSAISGLPPEEPETPVQ